MKFSYKFSNLLGAVYRRGNLSFTQDGDSIVSPVGNRITKFDLKNNKAETIPIEAKFNVCCVAISPDGTTALLVDENGAGMLCSLISKTVLHHVHFHRPETAIKYSPDGKKIALTKDNLTLIYHAPGSTRDYNPLLLQQTYYGAYDENTCIDWASDSRVLAVGSKDMNTRVFAATKLEQLVVYTLGGHKDCVVATFFEENSLNLYTISRRAELLVWNCDTKLEELQIVEGTEGQIQAWGERPDPNAGDEPKKKKTKKTDESEEKQNKILYKRTAKHFFNKAGDFNNLTCADYHKKNHILVTGFASGDFHLHELPDFNLIHSLSISDQRIGSVVFNQPGDWIGFGCMGLGQLLVWEWQSECYVLKQQGHYNNMTCLDFSLDGQLIVSGAEDGKVKVWNTSSGSCFVTFTEHTAGITGISFNQAGKVVVSASLDGTVRAFDLHRYRNFRTFTSPQPSQFSCLALDHSGEIVCAGAQDRFEIFVWAMKTGRLLEVLAGHEGPVSSLSFNPTTAILASASWDKTVKLWDVFERKGARETLQLSSDALGVAFRPDGKEVAIATLDFQITFWDVHSAVQTGSIEGKHDLGSGRKEADMVTAKTSSTAKSFNTLCYSADGSCILAAGKSKNVCIYNIKEQLLMKKFEVTCNQSLDGVQEFLDRRKMTEFGSSALVDTEGDEGQMQALSLPGVTKGDMSSRFYKPEASVSCVRFSATGRQWAATTTEGLLVYSLDSSLTFDPFDLTLDITPNFVRETLKRKEWSSALMLSFRLNEIKLIQEVAESIPWKQIEMVSQGLPEKYVEKMLGFVATQLESSQHLEFYLMWSEKLLGLHTAHLKAFSSTQQALLRALQKSMTRRMQDLGKLCDSNRYSLQYFLTLATQRAKIPVALGDDNGSEKDNQSDMDASDGDEDEGRVKGLADVNFSSDSESEIAELVKH